MSKIEEVAKAIYEGRNGHGCKAWSRLPKDHQKPYLFDAHAAIKAMREPTRAMSDAGRDNNYMRYADPAWRAMISAALSEEGE